MKTELKVEYVESAIEPGSTVDLVSDEEEVIFIPPVVPLVDLLQSDDEETAPTIGNKTIFHLLLLYEWKSHFVDCLIVHVSVISSEEGDQSEIAWWRGKLIKR